MQAYKLNGKIDPAGNLVITEPVKGEHPNESLNLFPHPQPLSHIWERGDIALVPLLPCLGEGVRG
ncbi:MAG: hypothetical protein ACYTXC_29540, partial [Nostoc sp.]